MPFLLADVNPQKSKCRKGWAALRNDWLSWWGKVSQACRSVMDITLIIELGVSAQQPHGACSQLEVKHKCSQNYLMELYETSKGETQERSINVETEIRISTLNSVHFSSYSLEWHWGCKPGCKPIFYQIWLKSSSMEMFPKYQMQGVHWSRFQCSEC